MRVTSCRSSLSHQSPYQRRTVNFVRAMLIFKPRSGYSIAVLLLFTTTTMLQFSSTALLSDLRLGQLPGLPTHRNVAFDFKYMMANGSLDMIAPGVSIVAAGEAAYPLQIRTPTWSRNPPAYPVFAEYSEPVSSAKDVDDTGILLRAFIPFSDAESRENIRNYTGNAMVLDSRVGKVCCRIYQWQCLTVYRYHANDPNFTKQLFR